VIDDLRPGACEPLAVRTSGRARAVSGLVLQRHFVTARSVTVLALLACAFFSVLAAAQPDGSGTHNDELVPLTRHEIRRLFTGRCQQPPAPRVQLHWSRWRRRHQATARACHCRRRAHAPA
jgi:hypothetical protein